MAESIREKLGSLASRNNTNVGKIERWASVLGGAALAAYALKRRNKGALGLAAIGAPLLWRGATGHCAVYQKMGIDRGQQQDLGHGSVFEQESVKPLAQPQSTEVGGVTSLGGSTGTGVTGGSLSSDPIAGGI
ncbi:MAG TPA: DUF2892 domain-containing protein [Thermoanaerobaculia bacterium]|nr:DUF2892 domain-containing protein [Thermoanaerobaculia bacterium]